jgi:hypothetical protein
MGDNNPREIMVIGSVRMRMHYGMMHILIDVRHCNTPTFATLLSVQSAKIRGNKNFLSFACVVMCLIESVV